MRILTEKINLDLNQNGIQATIDLREGDIESRLIIATLRGHGDAFRPDDNVIAVIRAKKPDGTIIFNNCVVEDGKVKFLITSQYAAVEGNYNACIEIVKNGEVLYTPKFAIHVSNNELSDSEVESSSEYTELTTALEQALTALELAESLNLLVYLDDLETPGDNKHLYVLRDEDDRPVGFPLVYDVDEQMYIALRDPLVKELDPETSPVYDDTDIRLLISQEAIARQAADNKKVNVSSYITDKANIEEEIAVERARIDQIANTPGSTTGDLELADIRVGADGVTYTSAGASVRTQLTDLDSSIKNVSDGNNVYDVNEFSRGQIENGSDGSYYLDRIKLTSIHNSGDFPKVFKTKSGFSASFVIYDSDGVYQYQSEYLTDYVIDKNTNYRLVIKDNSHVEADRSTPANISSLKSKLFFNSVVTSNIELAYKGKMNKTLLDVDMEMGMIGSDGNNNENEYNKPRKMRCVSYVYLNKGDVITVKNSALRMMVFHFGMHKVFTSQTSWITTSYTSEKDEYIRIQFARVDDNIILDKYKSMFRKAITIDNNISDILANINNNITDLQALGGKCNYNGEKLDLNKYTYDIEELWNFSNPTTTGTFVKEASAYNNGVVFKCYHTNLIQLYNFTDGTKIAEFPITCGHGDCIDFSNEYYDSNDEFPLAYITADTNPATVYINRITRSAATLIKTLTFPLDKTGYYAGHCLDNINNVIYQLGYKNEDYQTTDNDNHMIVSKWDLSKLTDNGDGTYTPAFINSFTLPFIDTSQGQAFLNGKMYVMSSNPYVPSGGRKTKIYVIDVGGQRISNILNDWWLRISDNEGEGVFFVPNVNNNFKYDMILDIQTRGLYRITF